MTYPLARSYGCEGLRYHIQGWVFIICLLDRSKLFDIRPERCCATALQALGDYYGDGITGGSCRFSGLQ